MSIYQWKEDSYADHISTSAKHVKEQGEVMTPQHIVEAMLAQIPDEVWKDPSYVFIEPSCGTGNFLIAVLNRRIKELKSVEKALNTIIAMEVNRDTLKKARHRLMKRALWGMKKKSSDRARNREKRLWKIVRNNIFWVEDSIAFIKNDGFASKKFVFDDPTGHNCVMTAEEQNNIPN